jgi:hypothetical protein
VLDEPRVSQDLREGLSFTRFEMLSLRNALEGLPLRCQYSIK